ncbi:MAG: right-handed parallel beta-helix repeat-containing protein [Piscinibacter sp.]|uniref:chondroitinase-B domain-containing protein n=1 Tax=Piscinibacter TaxID=1114981 RepID=UPI000FDE9C54|nr:MULTISPECIES: chondroitinase-B domain-containing protein [Piscinibacter]MCW5665620.1 right-handed parallel beta-helix repeat-containing protein [Piscinibacter sp.]
MRWPRALGGLLLAGVALGGAALLLASFGEVPPRRLADALERRARGHDGLAGDAARLLARAVGALDARLAPLPLRPAWAVGVQPQGAAAVPALREQLALDDAQLRQALAQARPGDVITLLPGAWRLSAPLDANRPGRADAPITLRARRPGEVTLEVDTVEALRVSAPYWHVENLVLRGVCREHSDCEHALHVSGDARGFQARHNELSDFNAHVKVNGHDGRFPDDGLLEHNTLANSAARRTDNPVTPVDIVGASRWTLRANLIADFVREAADTTSYGAFAKGAAEGTRMLGNVVLCEHRLRGRPGSRVGLSLGGGGSQPYACRDRRCVVEHDAGLIEGNLIAFCSDAGIDLNGAARSLVRHNTLVDTGGLSARTGASSAELDGNLVDGALLARQGASLHGSDDLATPLWRLYLGSHPQRALFADPAALDFAWRDGPPRRAAAAASAPTDLCGASRPAAPAYGAFEDFRACTVLTPR